MANPTLPDPRRYFGYSGKPLAVAPEAVPMPQQMRDRFKRADMEAFAPYVDPWQTIADAQQYRRAGNAMQIADAEDALVEEVGSGRTGFQQFLQKNPIATFSPMAQAYQRSYGSTRQDPYERTVAGGGPKALQDYRNAVAGGMEPLEAYSLFQAQQDKEREAKSRSQNEALWFVSKGGNLEDYEMLRSQGKNIQQMQSFLNEQPKDLTVAENIKLDEELKSLQSRLNAIADPGGNVKREIFTQQRGAEPKSEQDWTDAYWMWHNKERQRILGDYQKFLEPYVKAKRNVQDYLPPELMGRPTASVPRILPNQADLPQTAVQQPTAPISSQRSTPRTVPTAAPQPQQPPPTRAAKDGTKPILSVSERKRPKVESAEDVAKTKAAFDETINRNWTSAKDSLAESLASKKDKLAGDQDLFKSLLRSVQINEAIFPEDVGLEDSKDFLGGKRAYNAADMVARYLGKDPNAIAEVKLPNGKSIELVDLPGGKHTWRDVVKAWADDVLGKEAPQTQEKTSFSYLWE